MNGVHDMGGMHGFGPIERDVGEPRFHHDWERRVFAIRVASPIPIPGGSRHNIEQMPPADYLSTSYYEKWLQSRLKGFIDAGVLTAEEVETRMAEFRDHPDIQVPRREAPELAGFAMEGHAGTKWLRNTAPVLAGEPIELVLALFDMSDGSYDSMVILDHFDWTCSGAPPVVNPAG